MRLWILLLAWVFLSGCATISKNTQSYLSQSPPIPKAVEVKRVPFIQQTEHQCGPASLAMVLAWAGKPTAADELSREVYTPGKSGTFQEDLLGAARRRGLLA